MRGQQRRAAHAETEPGRAAAPTEPARTFEARSLARLRAYRQEVWASFEAGIAARVAETREARLLRGGPWMTPDEGGARAVHQARAEEETGLLPVSWKHTTLPDGTYRQVYRTRGLCGRTVDRALASFRRAYGQDARALVARVEEDGSVLLLCTSTPSGGVGG